MPRCLSYMELHTSEDRHTHTHDRKMTNQERPENFNKNMVGSRICRLWLDSVVTKWNHIWLRKSPKSVSKLFCVLPWKATKVSSPKNFIFILIWMPIFLCYFFLLLWIVFWNVELHTHTPRSLELHYNYKRV